jgi:hypothetical protein
MQPNKNKNPPDETHKEEKKTWEAKVHDKMVSGYRFLIVLTPILLAVTIAWPPAALFCVLLVFAFQLVATVDDEDDKKN